MLTTHTGTAQHTAAADLDFVLDAHAEAEAARIASPHLAALDEGHSEWLAQLDACGADASVHELLQLLQTAPSGFGAGLAFAKLSARAQERAEAYAELHALRRVMATSDTMPAASRDQQDRRRLAG